MPDRTRQLRNAAEDSKTPINKMIGGMVVESRRVSKINHFTWRLSDWPAIGRLALRGVEVVERYAFELQRVAIVLFDIVAEQHAIVDDVSADVRVGLVQITFNCDRIRP